MKREILNLSGNKRQDVGRNQRPDRDTAHKCHPDDRTDQQARYQYRLPSHQRHAASRQPSHENTDKNGGYHFKIQKFGNRRNLRLS